jgi:hypothetical protein
LGQERVLRVLLKIKKKKRREIFDKGLANGVIRYETPEQNQVKPKSPARGRNFGEKESTTIT